MRCYSFDLIKTNFIVMSKFILFVVFIAIINAQIKLPPNDLIASPISTDLIAPVNSAECYEGKVDVTITKGESSRMSYFACFVQDAAPCKFQKCFNGWIANYTNANGVTQGYPQVTQNPPVFSFQINSAADYIIKKSNKLNQDFDRLIDIACGQFDPTVASPRTKVSTSSPTSKLKSILLKADNTFNLLKGDKLNLDEEQVIYIPDYKFAPQANNIYSATAIPQKLIFSDLEEDKSSISRSLKYDANSESIVQRSEKILVGLSNTYFEQTPGNSVFNGQISLGLVRKGKGYYNEKRLKADLSAIKNTFSREDLQAQRANINIAKLDGFAETDNLYDSQKATFTESKAFDLNSAFTSPSQELSLSTAGRNRLLQQATIFSKQMVLFEKTVLGKKVKVSILVVATLDSTKQILTVTGTLKFDFFGKTKDIKVFQRSQNVNFNWTYNKTLSGSWSFSINVPLPPPVSFISINFSFSASYSIVIKLSATGSASGTGSLAAYTAVFLADVGTQLGVDASAALRLVVVEGGVYIKGTLVSVRTDPKVILKYLLQKKILELTVDWKFYLRAFSFKWGFFWRYWRPFKWSDKIIIKEYPISNGIEKTFTALSLFKTYQL